MSTRDLPNFPLLFEQIGHFLKEVHPLEPQQEEDRQLAWDAFRTIVDTVYYGIIRCNGHPPIPSLEVITKK